MPRKIAPAVERRAGNQVEEGEPDVHLDHVEDRQREVKRSPPAELDQPDVEDREHEPEEDIHHRPGQRDQQVRGLERDLPRDRARREADLHRLAPAEDLGADRGIADRHRERHHRQDQGADEVDVRDRIERHPPLRARQRIAEPIGDERVAELVDADAQDERDQIHRALSDVLHHLRIHQRRIMGAAARIFYRELGRPPGMFLDLDSPRLE